MSKSIITSSLGVWIGDEGILSLEELALACGAEIDCIIELVGLGVLTPKGAETAAWRFAAADIQRARRLLRLMRDFETSLEVAAVILDLLEEAERLRACLRRAGLAAD
ncbi:chaperone modulator CbpM [Methylococcus geothermalis]|uniref:MerR family transcriptional regulator n=1 Tax=Methylococcus geothermalis TaxID=2681310 RepID=A0A858Q610_9GAMM|nr:chaperone modulator CbpM [Methylococcus geothermalis]QJD29288.1 MerR family transcriptional regulator [Methylococcus geothermalis]